MCWSYYPCRTYRTVFLSWRSGGKDAARKRSKRWAGAIQALCALRFCAAEYVPLGFSLDYSTSIGHQSGCCGSATLGTIQCLGRRDWLTPLYTAVIVD